MLCMLWSRLEARRCALGSKVPAGVVRREGLRSSYPRRPAGLHPRGDAPCEDCELASSPSNMSGFDIPWWCRCVGLSSTSRKGLLGSGLGRLPGGASWVPPLRSLRVQSQATPGEVADATAGAASLWRAPSSGAGGQNDKADYSAHDPSRGTCVWDLVGWWLMGKVTQRCGWICLVLIRGAFTWCRSRGSEAIELALGWKEQGPHPL